MMFLVLSEDECVPPYCRLLDTLIKHSLTGSQQEKAHSAAALSLRFIPSGKQPAARSHQQVVFNPHPR
ncbi:unnamed protein product [Boreogadus saida]